MLVYVCIYITYHKDMDKKPELDACLFVLVCLCLCFCVYVCACVFLFVSMYLYIHNKYTPNSNVFFEAIG